eukprot:TRINITY_DN1409_c0_g1_i1.p1 TRINITY_DN1409_c0_g1~~TRINITY_DN1409_c0_g1_i1.p1  ORF type:complete len:173 (+),score=22.34 TRINITY_DN1409_c0_g1_i1:99-617(+)
MAQAMAMPLASSIWIASRDGQNHGNSVSLRTASPSSPLLQFRGLSIRCARVGGVEIPNNKRIEYSLQYIHGIGRTLARQILNDLNMVNKITKDLSEEELVVIREEIKKREYKIEGELRRFNALNIRRLKEIQCYRGMRHSQGLPCRGQRTKNNCRTLKGKRVAIAGKKKAPR